MRAASCVMFSMVMPIRVISGALKRKSRRGVGKDERRLSHRARATGLDVVDAQRPVERARSVRSAEEVKCNRASLRAAEVAAGKLRGSKKPQTT